MNSLLKKCPRCHEKKNRANFSDNGYCSDCSKAYQADYRASKPRKCRGCKEVKKPEAYSSPKSRSCTECVEANVERRIEYQKNYVKPEPYAAEKACPLMAAFLYGKLI